MIIAPLAGIPAICSRFPMWRFGLGVFVLWMTVFGIFAGVCRSRGFFSSRKEKKKKKKPKASDTALHVLTP